MRDITLNDPFGKAIYDTICSYGFTSCLELGSLDGEGSTQAFIKALSKTRNPRLVCLEANPERFKNLVKSTQKHPWVENVCDSTLSLASFSLSDFDKDVWNSPYNKLKCSYEEFKSWWEPDFSFIKNVTSGYLEYSNEHFDAVLIDGSELCGYDEYRLVKDRVQCLMLDDAFHAFKNNRVHQELLKDKSWKLIFEDPNIRNGASIFIRSHLRPLSWWKRLFR